MLILKKEVTSALNFALNKGFQIHPDALEILERVDVKELEKVIREIVRSKSKQDLYLINQNDLELFFGIKEDGELENDHRILSDPSERITTAEGIDGYNSLFKSRFIKLKKIISNRPEAKLLKSIGTVIGSKSKEDLYVCGLLSERKSERNITKLTLDDPTGSIETIV